jgi:hypothetical protein
MPTWAKWALGGLVFWFFFLRKPTVVVQNQAASPASVAAAGNSTAGVITAIGLTANTLIQSLGIGED